MTVVSQAEYARLHGVSKKTVTTWKARQLLVLAEGGVDVEASDERIKRHRRDGLPVTHAGNSGNAASAPDLYAGAPLVGETPQQAAERILATHGDLSFEEARTLKENYLALLSKLEYDQKTGLVVEVSAVAGALAARYAKVRTKLLAIPAEQAPKLYRCKTVNELQDALLVMITRALEELTRESGGDDG